MIFTFVVVFGGRGVMRGRFFGCLIMAELRTEQRLSIIYVSHMLVYERKPQFRMTETI